MNPNQQMNRCLEMFVELIEYPQQHDESIDVGEVTKLLGNAIRKYEKQGFKVPQEYKNKYKELKR